MTHVSVPYRCHLTWPPLRVLRLHKYKSPRFTRSSHISSGRLKLQVYDHIVATTLPLNSFSKLTLLAVEYIHCHYKNKELWKNAISIKKLLPKVTLCHRLNMNQQKIFFIKEKKGVFDHVSTTRVLTTSLLNIHTCHHYKDLMVATCKGYKCLPVPD